MALSLLRALVIATVLANPLPAAAQASAGELKAVLMAKFARFVSWPGGAAPVFRLCLVGRSEMAASLARLAELTQIKERPTEFLNITLDGETARCDMLFIGASEHDNLDQILATVARQPVLTVGDSPNYAQRGVMINFTETGSRVRFEINSQAARAAGLRISSRLLKLATSVVSPQAMNSSQGRAP